MKVTVLIENTAPEGSGLVAEAGLSFWIEYNGKKILLDAGSSGRFVDNAEQLHIDLGQTQFAVLSHGHFDHADGFRAFFRKQDTVKVCHRSGADGQYFSRRAFAPYYIGIHRALWEENRNRFVEVNGIFPLTQGAWLLPDGERYLEFAGKATDLLVKRGRDEFVADDFSHEQSLVFETKRGLAVFNSCSHSGIVNIVRGVQNQMSGRPVYAVVGGFHLFGKDTPNGMNCSEEYVYRVADTLKEMGVEEIYTGHCTGVHALARLQERFGAGCHSLTTGLTFEL